jgi:flagellar capping protein FliD
LNLGAVLTQGEDSFSLNVDSAGIFIKAKDSIDRMLQPDGFFDAHLQSSEAIEQAISRQTADMQERLQEKQNALTAKFAALESALATLQAQSGALTAQINQFASAK